MKGIFNIFSGNKSKNSVCFSAKTEKEILEKNYLRRVAAATIEAHRITDESKINEKIEAKEKEINVLNGELKVVQNEIRSTDSTLESINKVDTEINAELSELDSELARLQNEEATNNIAIQDGSKLEELKKEADYISQAAGLVGENAKEYSKLGINVAQEEASAKTLLADINELEGSLNLEKSKPLAQIDWTKFDKEVEQKIDSLVSEIEQNIEKFDLGVNDDATIQMANYQFEIYDDTKKNPYQKNWTTIKSSFKTQIDSSYSQNFKIDNFFNILESKLKGFAEVSDNFIKLKTEYDLIKAEMKKSPKKDLSLFEKLSRFNDKLKNGYNEMLMRKKDLETSFNAEMEKSKRQEIERLNKELLDKKSALTGIQDRLSKKAQFEGIIKSITEIIAKVSKEKSLDFSRIAQSFIASSTESNMKTLIDFVNNLKLESQSKINSLNGGKESLKARNEKIHQRRAEILKRKKEIEQKKAENFKIKLANEKKNKDNIERLESVSEKLLNLNKELDSLLQEKKKMDKIYGSKDPKKASAKAKNEIDVLNSSFSTNDSDSSSSTY